MPTWNGCEPTPRACSATSKCCGSRPLNVYGESKAHAERSVLALHSEALVVRTSALFGPWDSHNFLTRTLLTLGRGETVPVACDQTVAPTYLPDLVNATLDLLLDGEHGLWHLANHGAVTWQEFAAEAAAAVGLSTQPLRGVSTESLGLLAQRPAYVVGSARSGVMPGLSSALGRFLELWNVA